MIQKLITWSRRSGKISAPCIPARKRFKQQTAVWLLFLLFSMPAWPAQKAQDIVLVLDNSGSMRKSDPGFLIKNAVTAFIETLGNDVRLAMLIFDQDFKWAVPFTKINNTNKPKILSSLDRINYGGLYTDSRAAMALAAVQLNQGSRAGAKKVIVFLTDGIVDTGDPKQDRLSEAWLRGKFASDAAENGISIIGLAFTENSDQDLVRTLADETGGTYYSIPAAQDLETTFTQVAQFINSMSMEDESTTEEAAQEEPAGDVTVAEGLGALQVQTEDQGEEAQEEPAGDETAAEGLGALQVQTADQEEEAQEEPAGDETAAEGLGALQVQTADQGEETQEESAGDETAAQNSAPDVTQEDQGERAGLQDSKAKERPAPAASAYLAVALVVIGIVVLAFVLYTRSRKKMDIASAATQIIQTAHKTPEVDIPQAFLDDLDKVTSKPRHTLRARKTVITRAKEIEDATAEHIRIPRDTVSRLHAAIEYESGAFWLSDYESSNGTYQNNHKVTGKQRLHDGDEIRFDTFKFRFVAPESQTGSNATVLQPATGNKEQASKTVVMPSKD